ncbi:MAG: Ig-like domain-containing protein, partial [Candidatus Saccharibacteria bacterium]
MFKRKSLSLFVIFVTCLSLLAPVFAMPQTAGAASTYVQISIPEIIADGTDQVLGRVKVVISPNSLMGYDAMTIALPNSIEMVNLYDAATDSLQGIGTACVPTTMEPFDDRADAVQIYVPQYAEGSLTDYNMLYDSTTGTPCIKAKLSSAQSLEIACDQMIANPMNSGCFFIYFSGKVKNSASGDIVAAFLAPAGSGFSSEALAIAKAKAVPPVTTLDPWNLVNSFDPNRFFYGVSFINGKFIICGYQDDVWSSDDGLSWTKMTTGCNLPTQVISVPQKPLVLICGDGSLLASNDGGTSWNLQCKTTDWLNAIAYGNNRYVAVGYAGEVLISNDGLNWASNRFTGPTYLRDITYGDGKFVAVGCDRAIMVSTDGFNWQKVDSGISETINGFAVDFHGVTYANGQFVLVGFRGTSLYSRDGYNWTQSPSIVNNTLFDVTFGDNKFIAVGDSGTIIASSDGQIWNEKYTPIVAGSLKGVAFGNGRFVTAGDWNTLLCSTTQPIRVQVTGVTLDQTALSLNTGATAALTATVAPLDATNKNVSWSSSNTGVATVENGVVTALAAGTSTITVKTEDGAFTADCLVTVTAPNVPVTGITLNKTGLMLTAGGPSATLKANVAPANATNKNVSWKSSNPKVATVDANGVVKPIKPGFALITATTQDGGFKAYCF